MGGSGLPTPAGRRLSYGLAAAVVLAAALAAAAHSARWIGRTFPGFLVLANRVVPSAALPGWTGTTGPPLYQRQIVAVNGDVVRDAADVHGRVAALSPGTAVAYDFARDGALTRREVPTMRFGTRDYLLVFGTYLVNGLVFVVAGLLLWSRAPRPEGRLGLLVLGVVAGLFALTAMDLYGPYRLFRLHALAEALFPAALVHAALGVGPALPRWVRRKLLLIAYGLCALLGAEYQLWLFDPTSYRLIHLACTVTLGMAGLICISIAIVGHTLARTVTEKRWAGAFLLGTLAGLGLPAALMLASGFTDGAVPVNWSGYTAILLPLSMLLAARQPVAVES